LSTSDLGAFIQEQMARGNNDVYAETHRHVDKLLLVRALEHTDGNQREAGVAAFLACRESSARRQCV
jgi:hypothetical protein